MSAKIYKNGTWQDVSNVKEYISGAWQDKSCIKAYENGVWVEKWNPYPAIYNLLSGTYDGTNILSNKHCIYSIAWEDGYYKTHGVYNGSITGIEISNELVERYNYLIINMVLPQYTRKIRRYNGTYYKSKDYEIASNALNQDESKQITQIYLPKLKQYGNIFYYNNYLQSNAIGIGLYELEYSSNFNVYSIYLSNSPVI